jgi:hypothetical protein
MDHSAAIAVLTWRGEETTRRCLQSMRSLPQWPAGILVVDNASGTGEGRRLAAEFGVESLTTARNDAVAGGYNAALGWAAARGLPYVLLLNNDTEIVDANVVQELLAAAGDGVAAVGPIVRNDDDTVWSTGGRLSLWTGRASHGRKPRGQEPYEVDWIDGSAMLVSVAAARAIGGLSTDFHLYWEETDWCLRARRAGYRVVVQPSASIRHARGGTVPGLDMRVWSLRSALLFLRRNASIAQLLVAMPAYLLLRVPVFCVRVTRAFGLRACLGGLRAAIEWNLIDAARRDIRVPADGPPIGDGAFR